MMPSNLVSRRLPFRFIVAVLLWGPSVAWAQNDMPAEYPENVRQVLSTTWSPDQPATYGLGYVHALEETRRRLARTDTVATIALIALREAARQALEMEPQSVTYQGQAPPSGDPHDYTSLPPYWWPNPNTEDGLPYVRRDGEVNPTSRRDDAHALGRMAHAVETLALAYALLGRAPYAQHAAHLLRTWFLDDETRMNPHLNFGQGVPGRSTGRRYGIIETRMLPQLIEAIGLIEPSAAWTETDQQNIKRWFRAYLEWLVTSDLGQKEARTINNHGVWYDAQVGALALFVGERPAAREVLRLAPQRMRSQVEPDGRQPEELARTRSFSYVAMNTLGFCQLAVLAERVDVDLWNDEGEDGRGLQRAINWMVFYADGTRPWPYEQITDVPWARVATVLRHAAHAYDNPAYEQLIRHVPTIQWKSLRINLLYPPLAPV